MAENGFFRSAFRGFNKEDVLKYIDELQTTSGERIATLEERCRVAEEATANSEAEAKEASVKAAQLEVEAESLRKQNENLTILAQAYKKELLDLRQQLDEVKAAHEDSVASSEALARIAELEERCVLLKEQNSRFAAIVGNVSKIVAQARVVSSSYFDAAKQKSAECIRRLDTFLTGLKNQTEEALSGSDLQSQLGEEFIDSLLSDLQTLEDSVQNGNNE